MEDPAPWQLILSYSVFALGTVGHTVLGYKRFASVAEGVRAQRLRQQRLVVFLCVVLLGSGLLSQASIYARLAQHIWGLLVALAVYAWVVYPYVLAPALRRYNIKRWLRQLPASLHEVPLGLAEWRLLKRLAREQPKSFLPTARVLLQFQADRPGLREAFPSLNRAYLYRLPDYLGLFCAQCMHFTALKQFKCARCGANDLYIGVEQFALGYAAHHPSTYWADRRAGRITLNLHHEAAWQFRHLRITAVTLDFQGIPNPDYLLNRVLTTWPQLTLPEAPASFSLTGLAALQENTRRLLSDRQLLPPPLQT